MKKLLSHALPAGLLTAATLMLSAPAHAYCGNYQPGMLAFIAGSPPRPAVCAYQGDYMVNQGPMYDGPARVAPQPTYAPARTATASYPYVHGQYKMSVEPVERTVVRTRPVKRTVVKRKVVKEDVVERDVVKRKAKRASGGKRMTVEVKNELPPTKGKPKVIRAQAEVRIYSPERMEIRLFRR
jgi:hypothetical protein